MGGAQPVGGRLMAKAAPGSRSMQITLREGLDSAMLAYLDQFEARPGKKDRVAHYKRLADIGLAVLMSGHNPVKPVFVTGSPIFNAALGFPANAAPDTSFRNSSVTPQESHGTTQTPPEIPGKISHNNDNYLKNQALSSEQGGTPASGVPTLEPPKNEAPTTRRTAWDMGFFQE